MAESSHKDKLTCKGCNFVIRGDKLLVHLNHPKIKCKEAYSKDEYSLVYDLWMQTKLEIKIQDQDKIKCRGCQFDLDKITLLWHLNDKKVDCKKAYSKDEYQHIFEFWLYHKENPAKLPFEDFPCNEMMECNGCKQMIISGKMYNHVRDSKECAEKYYKQPLWDGILNLESRYSKLLEDIEQEKVEKHFFKNVIEQEPLNSKGIKPIFLEYGAIDDFVRTAFETRTADKQYWYGTFGVLLGVEDDYGFHGKELIYLPKQDREEYWRHFDVKGFKAIMFSKTFKDYPKSARILVWMTTGDCFDGYDAHTQATNLKPLSDCAITLKAKMASYKLYEVGDYGLFELNELGIQAVQKCTFKQKKKEETILCCQYHYKNFDKSLYHHKPVTLTYSTIINVKDKRKHYRLNERRTIPALFNPKYFAKIDTMSTNETLNLSNMKPNEVETRGKQGGWLEIRSTTRSVKKPSEVEIGDYFKEPFLDTNEAKSDNNDTEVDMKHELPVEICKTCNKPLKINTIMKHLSSKSTCIKSYSDQDLKIIQKKVTNFRNENRRIKRSEQKESSEEVIYCKVCHSKCHINTIKRHLANFPSCQKQYPKDELQSLELKCEYWQSIKRSIRDKARNTTKKKSGQSVVNDGVSIGS